MFPVRVQTHWGGYIRNSFPPVCPIRITAILKAWWLFYSQQKETLWWTILWGVLNFWGEFAKAMGNLYDRNWVISEEISGNLIHMWSFQHFCMSNLSAFWFTCLEENRAFLWLISLSHSHDQVWIKDLFQPERNIQILWPKYERGYANHSLIYKGSTSKVTCRCQMRAHTFLIFILTLSKLGDIIEKMVRIKLHSCIKEHHLCFI